MVVARHKRTRTGIRPSLFKERVMSIHSFLWLLLGAGSQLFAFGRWMTPLAAWLMPVFVLHFAHGMPPVTGGLWIWLALAIAMGISLRGVVPIPGIAYLVLPVFTGLLGSLPFLIDRLVAPLLPGAWATLVFPATWTALEFLVSRWHPYGTWGAVGYTQHGVLPLVQLASVTGIWGIGFVIGWFASIVNWVWDQQLVWTSVQHGVLSFAAVAGAIVLLGGLRIAFAPERKTVRIAGIGWPSGIVEASEFLRAVEPDFTDAERDKLHPAFARIQDSFLERSEREARAGSKIIVWPEANLIVFAEDEAAFLERAQALARDYKVYVVIGLATITPGKERPLRNQSVLITPAGHVAYTYTKITAVPGLEKRLSIPGDKPIPLADTEYGRVASPICYDMDFDGLIRQVGRGKADLMLVPASDWKEITFLHQPMAEFRAIENGTALFRITRWGASGAIDRYGRRLAWMDDFSTDDNVMVANVPTRAGVPTLYARVGDVFAWSCVAALAAAIGLYVARALA
jgi:apolipoprotein N-acyltransferase